MDYTNPAALVSTDWLAKHLEAPDVRVVDCTWFMPGSDRDADAEFEAGHIPGAVRFDVDEIADTVTDLPHMLPSPEKFSSKVRKLGLGAGNRIVCYDANGGFMAAMRVWWMFRYFGHDDVAVLNGGLPKWLVEGRDLEDGPARTRDRHFLALQRHHLVRSLRQMIAIAENASEQVVDARSAARFSGAEAEPRAGLRKGAIPGSLNLPFPELLDMGAYGTLRPASELRAAFTAAGVDLKKPFTATCGSGITAAVIAFAAYLLGQKDVAVYDGSFAEWGAAEGAPVVVAA